MAVCACNLSTGRVGSRGIPGTGWPANLAQSANSRFSEGHRLKEKIESN